jgi:hypothetical protein
MTVGYGWVCPPRALESGRLPAPRDPLTDHIFGYLTGPVRQIPAVGAALPDPLSDALSYANG